MRNGDPGATLDRRPVALVFGRALERLGDLEITTRIGCRFGRHSVAIGLARIRAMSQQRFDDLNMTS